VANGADHYGGERRGGRQPGTPNKKTALVNTAFTAATSNPALLPLESFLAVMRDPSIPADWRFKAAQAAAPCVHPKAERAQALDVTATTEQIEGSSKYESFLAYERAAEERTPRPHRSRRGLNDALCRSTISASRGGRPQQEPSGSSLTARPTASATDNAAMPLLDPKIGRGLFAAIALNLVLDGLSLVERTQASPFNSRDVDKHIFATAA
jgi:hypothetical protein